MTVIRIYIHIFYTFFLTTLFKSCGRQGPDWHHQGATFSGVWMCISTEWSYGRIKPATSLQEFNCLNKNLDFSANFQWFVQNCSEFGLIEWQAKMMLLTWWGWISKLPALGVGWCWLACFQSCPTLTCWTWARPDVSASQDGSIFRFQWEVDIWTGAFFEDAVAFLMARDIIDYI